MLPLYGYNTCKHEQCFPCKVLKKIIFSGIKFYSLATQNADLGVNTISINWHLIRNTQSQAPPLAG